MQRRPRHVGRLLISAALTAGACSDSGRGAGTSGGTDGSDAGEAECAGPSDCPEIQCPDMGFPVQACANGVCGTYESICGEPPPGSESGVEPEPCTPETCPGCCDPELGCRSGGIDGECGAGGVACMECPPEQICGSSLDGWPALRQQCGAAPLSTQWVRTHGAEGQQFLALLGVDPQGNPVGIYSTRYNSTNEVVKFDGDDGSRLWANPLREWKQGLVDAEGGVVAVQMDLDELCSVHQLGSDGGEQWVLDLGAFCFSKVARIEDRLVLWGSFEGSLDVAGNVYASEGETDVFVGELDPSDGTLMWGASLGSPAADWASDVARGSDGELVVVAGTDGSLAVGGETLSMGGGLVGVTPEGAFELLFEFPDDAGYSFPTLHPDARVTVVRREFDSADSLLEFDASGSVVWEVAVNPFSALAKLPESGMIALYGLGDFVIRSLDAQGTDLYAQTYDPYPSVEPDELQASDLVVGPNGDLFVSGMYVLPGRFHDFELPELQGTPGDAFLLRLRPGTPP